MLSATPCLLCAPLCNYKGAFVKFADLTEKIIKAALEVHSQLGPGLLESTYEECLVYELQKMDLHIEHQKSLPLVYKEITLECGYRIDILVENKVIVELKSIDEISPVHEAQILTYLKLAKKEVGLLINFNVKQLKNGLKRFVM